MTTPAVVFGGPSDEHDISILTGLQVSHALKDVLVFYWSKGGEWFQVDPDSEARDFVDGPPRKAKAVNLIPEVGQGFVGKKPIPVSAVVNACHGGPGEDGTLQGIFDLAGIRYTGPGQAASALGMDKFGFGASMAATGLPTLPRALLASSDQEPPPFSGPYIVKPRFGGSSIGIEVVEDWPTADRVVEGIAVLRQRGSSRTLSRGEPRPPDGDPHMADVGDVSNRGADTGRGTNLFVQSEIPCLGRGGLGRAGTPGPASIRRLTRSCAIWPRRVVVAAGLRGVCRIDFLEKDSEVWVNEVNTIPGSMARVPLDRSENPASGPFQSDAR